MSSKIIKSLVLCLFSFCFAIKANASLIVGDLYSDAAGAQWEYFGSFDLKDGPDVMSGAQANTYNGIEAALFHFNTLSGSEIALSTNKESDYTDISNFIVNHHAFYDTFDGGALGIFGISEQLEDIITDVNGNNSYDAQGDISAYVWDRAAFGEEFLNHVFKRANTSVPEPSTLVIFSLALISLASRRFKK